ncbi:hypothetical protein [Castellaniella caeni]
MFDFLESTLKAAASVVVVPVAVAADVATLPQEPRRYLAPFRIRHLTWPTATKPHQSCYSNSSVNLTRKHYRSRATKLKAVR